GEPLCSFGMLASTAAMLFQTSAGVVERVFLTAWSRAQTGRVRAGAGERPLSRWLAVLVRPLPRVPGCLFAKDVTVFLRDASQWSQLLLVSAPSGLLRVPRPVPVVFLVTLVPLMAAVVSLGLAFGAVYPRLDTQNAAQIATGFGAILYMLACLGLIALVVALEAWPVSRLLAEARSGTVGTQTLVALAAGAGSGVGVAAVGVAKGI